MRRRDRQLEPVWVPQPEYARSPGRVGRLRFESAAALLNRFCNFVDVLLRRDLQREALALGPIPPLGTVILIDQEPHIPCSERNRPQPSLALVFSIDLETRYIA